jgi:hypothetical protein
MDQVEIVFKVIDTVVGASVAGGTIFLGLQAYNSDQTSRILSKNAERIEKPEFVVVDERQPEEQSGQMRHDVLVTVTNIGKRPAKIISVTITIDGVSEKADFFSGSLALPSQFIRIKVKDASRSGVIAKMKHVTNLVSQEQPVPEKIHIKAYIELEYIDPKGPDSKTIHIANLPFNPLAYRPINPSGHYVAWIE